MNKGYPAKTQPDEMPAPGSPAGLEAYSGEWDTLQVVHLLKRTLFGARAADITYFKSLTMEQAVNELLQPAPLPAEPPLNNYMTDPTGVAPWQTWIDTGLLFADKELNENRVRSLQCWWTGQLLNQGRSIHEKMTLFWHNHFAMDATAHFEDINARLWYNQYLTLRANALGNFKQLVKSITLDPAMLLFLNGSTNQKKSPNENFARELQELYTVGKGINSKYTEDDVRAAARVLTGHSVDVNFNYVFLAGNHDDDNKSFSTFYSNHTITGRSGEPGATEVDELIDMLLATDEAARFICRKLYSFFVYYQLDDAIETNIIGPLADIFRKSGYNITEVLRTLFTSQHFYDLVNSGACIIKSPLDFLIGLVHEYNVALPAADDAAGRYAIYKMLLQRATELQQEILGIDEVAGWYPYYQAPNYHELWINSVTYTQRNFYTDLLISTGDMMDGAQLTIDPLAFTKLLPNPGDPNQLVTDAVNILLRTGLSDSSKQLLKQTILLSNQTNDLYWTQAWQAYLNNPADMNAAAIAKTHLQALYKYLMNLPEYQLS
ncbi:DUF1800 domain-containing protein [Deminuibacter soli]|uniref:DUF1800 domain-containing protein n=1 Tax=Deminuibacter soli TaxID=2291815 RepID=A0A3E1NPV2_9BACT|nr:DUF1800 domain-containing protein [Deminuibacter soli]RFM29818.1 DUF1800 domain-containing protein [Deminuibacter soli]